MSKPFGYLGEVCPRQRDQKEQRPKGRNVAHCSRKGVSVGGAEEWGVRFRRFWDYKSRWGQVLFDFSGHCKDLGFYSEMWILLRLWNLKKRKHNIIKFNQSLIIFISLSLPPIPLFFPPSLPPSLPSSSFERLWRMAIFLNDRIH